MAAYQPMPPQQQHVQQGLDLGPCAEGMPMLMGGSESIGITTTPKPGWECCNLPPCVCCGHPVYFSDNHKTWGDTGFFKRGMCGHWSVQNAKIRGNSPSFDYFFEQPLCGSGFLRVQRQGGMEVGRINIHHYCCPFGQLMHHAVDAQGRSRYTRRYPNLGCGPRGCCYREKRQCCQGHGGCCPMWARYDLFDVYGPEAASESQERVVATVTNQMHAICPFWFPAWTGYDATPPTDDDDKALLLGFVLLSGALYPQQALRYNYNPPTIGAAVL